MKELIKVTPNYSNQTFTIRKYDQNGTLLAKYRTFRLPKDEFESMEFDTENDWKHFLTSCDGDYFKV